MSHEIKDLTFTNSEYVPDKESDKLACLDIVCALDSGEMVDVEMQVARAQYSKTQLVLLVTDVFKLIFQG